MVDLKALRKDLEQQIDILREQLAALDIVERAVLARGMSAQESVAGPLNRKEMSRTGSITEACRQLVQSQDREWSVKTVLQELRAQRFAGSSRANVSTALRRLVEEGVLRQATTNKKMGYTYRLRQPVLEPKELRP